ncbi:hypothetical protein EBR04_00500 [bacterium]|nr:hypothetical protein [bacterium]
MSAALRHPGFACFHSPLEDTGPLWSQENRCRQPSSCLNVRKNTSITHRDLLERSRVEDRHRPRHGTQRCPGHAESLADLVEGTGPLEVTQTLNRRAEECHQDQGAVLIHEQPAIAGPVAFRTHLPQP